MTRAAELCRIVVAQDGRLKANFSDNSILLLNSEGNAFIHCSPQGQISRQLSEYALSRYSIHLAVVLGFRNMHIDQPFINSFLLKSTPGSLSLGYRIVEVWWPGSLAHASEKQLVQTFPDGRVAVSADDGSARIVLHFHRRRFAICYPLLVQERPLQGRFLYIWHTQVFSLQSYPTRWQPAIELALAAADALLSGISEQPALSAHAGATAIEGCSNGTDDWPAAAQATSCGTSKHGGDELRQCQHEKKQQQQLLLLLPPPEEWHKQLVTQADATAYQQTAAASRASRLPTALPSGAAGICDSFPANTWWFEQTLTLLPNDEVVTLEWTSEATYQYHPGTDEVEAWIHADESSLCSMKQGRYLEHCKGPASGKQLYVANCVPDMIWSSDGSKRYCLGAVAAHAIKLREQMSANVMKASCKQAAHQSLSGASHHSRYTSGLECVDTPDNVASCHVRNKSSTSHAAAYGDAAAADQLDVPLESTFAVLSEEVLESSEVPGQGSFTAFADGRIRAIFGDRTILHMNRAHSHCKVTLPDGTSSLVSTANPVGVELYVQAVMPFSAWAFKTPHERAQELRAQARVRAELANSQRMAALCGWAATKQLPAAASAAAAAGAGGSAAAAEEAGDAGWHSSTKMQAPALKPSTEASEPWDPMLFGAHMPTPPPAAGAMAVRREQLIQQLLQRNAELLQRL